MFLFLILFKNENLFIIFPTLKKCPPPHTFLNSSTYKTSECCKELTCFKCSSLVFFFLFGLYFTSPLFFFGFPDLFSLVTPSLPSGISSILHLLWRLQVWRFMPLTPSHTTSPSTSPSFFLSFCICFIMTTLDAPA